MKKKNIPKKLLAVLLSFIMIATTMPLTIIGSAAGAYDPAPKFSEDAITEGARAWLDNEGNVRVTFPAAEAEPTYKGEDLSIAFYVLELVDMGANNAAHSHTTLDTLKVTGLSGIFAAADIGEIDLESRRYSVTVTAVDTENWFSQPIYTTVTDVPVAEIDGSRFANFSTSATAVREIMTFESGTDDGAVTQGSQLHYMGVAEEAGTEDLSDNIGDTSALRFIMYDQPTGTQSFDTSYSRQTWDFNGAEEMWCWMDLSRVELEGISFRLCTNEKMWVEWKDGTIETTQRAGETVYSTKGTAASTYTGEDPYVYVQREDGGWNKVMLKDDGTVDLGNFMGYVRVPLKFMCSETATYVDISNQEFGQSKSFTSGINNTVNESNAFSWMAGMTFSQKVLVDNAGTSISDALLIHRRGYKTSSGFLNLGTKHTFTWNINGQYHATEELSSYDYSQVGYMLAMPLNEDSAKTAVTTGNASTDRAYVSGTTVMNREGGLKAIEDIYNAGFSIEGCSEDSLQNSFFIDNIFFYRTDGGAYSENTLDGNVNTGDSMSTYYDEELEISRIIFDEIDKYISDPDWADYREIEYILELIAEYNVLYTEQGKDTTFLDVARDPQYDTDGNPLNLAASAATLDRAETWERAWQAWEACYNEGTIALDGSFPSNARKNELVPLIINTMEKLPDPDNITSVSDALRAEIVKLWQAYSLLNLGQLEMLGATEEEKLLKYFTLVENLEATDGDEFVVGQRLADNPFIVFNDFESYELGEEAWRLEDNKDAYTSNGGTSNLANDWRHIKSLVTYTTNGNTNITDKDYYGYVTTDEDKSQEAIDGKVNYNASWATITNDGYLNSKGVNLYSDSSFTTSENDGVFHTITVTKDGNPIGTDYSNNMSAVNLGGLAQTYTGASDTSVPLSLIFYVDFTQVENFYFTVNVFTIDENGNHVKCRVNTGLDNADRKYWILDNETGEWEIIYTTNQWVFNSAGNEEESTNQGVDYNKIEGYRGYLMVPLYHIKQYNNLVSEDKLDEEATLLNNIFAIQFCIGGANATDMDEKSIVIDNVGFTYSKDSYTAASSRTDKSYAEVFGAKSLPAANFEAAVDAIDPYDETTISATTQAAQAIYNTLPDYQKQVVADAYADLKTYIVYANDASAIPQPAIEAADLQTWITENLTADATGASVTGDNELVYPGFTNGEVNYSSYGLTADLAAQLSDFYTNSYVYYTVAEKQTVKDAGFLNAYNAAMRCLGSLEAIKTEAGSYGSASAGTAGSGFLGELSTGLYTRKYDEDGNFVGNFVSIEGRDTVENFKESKYDILQYYTKTTMDDGTYNTNVQNISRGFTYFLNNTQSFEVDGEIIEGGIITFRDKMQAIYDMANDRITNKKLFTDEELQSVRDIIEEYNALLPAYYNVEELYELEQAILDLFPEYQTSMGEQTLMLSAENLSKSTTYTIEYSEYLDITDPYTDTFYVKVVSQNGYMTNDYGDIVSYNVSLASNEYNSYTVDASELTGLEESAWAATYPVTNNSSTPDGTQQVYTLTAGVAIAQTRLRGMVTDVLTIQLCHPDGTVLEEYPVQVFYSMGDAYTVTIPAEIPVDWGYDEETDVSYKVITEMNVTSKISVGVTTDGTGKLTNSITEDKLNYTVNDEFELITDFSGMVAEGKPDPAPTVTVSGWDDVPVGEYRTMLTYTVVYDDGSDDSTT